MFILATLSAGFSIALASISSWVWDPLFRNLLRRVPIRITPSDSISPVKDIAHLGCREALFLDLPAQEITALTAISGDRSDNPSTNFFRSVSLLASSIIELRSRAADIGLNYGLPLMKTHNPIKRDVGVVLLRLRWVSGH